MTQGPSPKSSQDHGGTHLGMQLQNSQTSVRRLNRELGRFGTDAYTAIPYKDEAQADAATNDPHLKLMFRLLKFEVQEEQDSAWGDVIRPRY